MKANTTVHVGTVSHRGREATEPSEWRTRPGLSWEVSHCGS